MDLYNEKDIRAPLDRHDFRSSKSMGQNFLIEGWVSRDIAEASGAGLDTGVLEIGPGIGPLTVQLARWVAKVVAIELDRTLYPILTEALAPCPNAEAVLRDATKLDPAAPVSDKFSGPTAIVCVNLPYNITTPVPIALIEVGCFASVTVMTQREVALRVCATPGSSDYGTFSVFCQYHTQPGLPLEMGPECLLPVPKVTSVVIRLVSRSAPPQNLTDDSFFFQMVRVPFVQRCKMSLNGLSSAFGSRLPEDALRGAIEAAGLSADIRGERLGIPEFVALASTLQNRF